MKPTKISFLVLLTFIMLWPYLATSQNGLTVIERLKANTWQLSDSEALEITFTDSIRIRTYYVSDEPIIIVEYYYLSDSPDSLFQRHKIGSAENGRYINLIWRESLLKGRNYTIQVSKILELNENKMILESQQIRGPILGRRTGRYVPKRN